MKATWQLPQQTTSIIDRRVTEVLVEYEEEPEVVLLLDSVGQLYLGVAADEDRDAVRWVHAPISKLEYEALLAGGLSVRDSMLKREVYVIDLDLSGSFLCAWDLITTNHPLPEEGLPRPGALLPTVTRKRLRHGSSNIPVLHLDGANIQKNTIPFDDLSKFTSDMQRVWTTFSCSLEPTPPRGAKKRRIAERATLAMAATGPGSFGIYLEPKDPTLFARVAELYASITSSADEPGRLMRALGSMNAQATNAYAKFLKTLRTCELQVLAEWDGHAAYISPSISDRILDCIGQYEQCNSRSIVCKGHFIGFSFKDRRFSFTDTTSQHPYSGEIDRSVHSAGDEKEMVVEVGAGPLYEVEISEIEYKTTQGSSYQYRLMRYRLYQDPDSPKKTVG